MLELHLSEKTSAQTRMFGLQEQQLKSPASPPFVPDGRHKEQAASFDHGGWNPPNRKKPGMKPG
jgi:hypothetical protein